MNRRCILLLVALVNMALATVTEAQPPQLGSCTPWAAAPGKSLDIVLQGGNLAGVTGIWNSFGATAELTPGIDQNGTKAGEVVYRFTLPPTAPVGVGAVRVATGKGISNLRLMMVDDLPSVARTGDIQAFPRAQALTLPVAVDGNCNPEASDFYKFTVAAGQRVAIEVVARRLGSALDPVIRLLDAAGKELAYSDDEASIGADSRLAYTFATAGEYVVELRDVRYQGGPTHRYRLRLGSFPLATTAYPLAVQKGTTATIQVGGPSVEAMQPVAVNIAADSPAERINVSVALPGGQGSSWVSVLASGVAEQLEKEPNDTPETSTPVTLGGAINGRFETPGDRDFFQFEAKQGQRMLLVGQTRSLGSPSDLLMRLLKPDGSVAVEAEDTGTEEGVLDFACPADGVYRLRVEDVQRRGGPEHAYRIAVEPYRAGFTLAIEAEKFDVPQEGVFTAKVVCVRKDYSGPITLAIEGAGEGIVLSNNVIPEGKPETVLTATLPPTIKSGQLQLIRIVGQAKIGETEFKARASNLAVLRKDASGLPYPPAALDGLVGLGVGPVFPAFFGLSVATPNVAFPANNGTASFKVQVAKMNGFDDKITLAVEGLPAGVTAKVPAVEKGKAEATIELASAQAVPAGKHPLKIVGSGTFQNQPKKVVLDQVALEVAAP